MTTVDLRGTYVVTTVINLNVMRTVTLVLLHGACVATVI